MDDKRIVRFDWAAKRLLRNKANFGVLEGREEGRAELIREMLNSGIDKDTIKKITGLSDEALQALLAREDAAS